MTVGVVSPGAMGSGLADALIRGGERVVATLDGRSPRTQELAHKAGFEFVDDLAAVVAVSDVLISIVPPGAALDVARAIVAVAAGHTPLVVDLNAVSPGTVDEIAGVLAGSRIDLVDGSISGPPPWRPGTRIYLSGRRAGEIAALGFDGCDVRVVGERVGAASALKMCTGSVYKGTALVLAHALVTARAHGVLETVLADLRTEFPELLESAERWLASSAAKSWRYVGEMREVAATQAGVGLTPAVFEGIAEAYQRLSGTLAAQATPEQAAKAERLDDVLAAMAAPAARRPDQRARS